MIAGALLCAAAATAAAPTDAYPKAAASYLVAVDGRVVWERDAGTPRLPASLTKIMTALVAVDGAWDPKAPVTIGKRAAAETGSRAGLRAGEVVAAGDLLTATLVSSANDACYALAEHAAGSEAKFVAAMNARAAAMGLTATRFANACGHDDPGQRTSARDMRTLAEEAMTRKEIATRAALHEATIATAKGRKFALKTGNMLLVGSPGVYGVKTGYTPGAGKCLVAAAERDGTRVLLVLLDADDRWWTAAGLVEKAFDEARGKR